MVVGDEERSELVRPYSRFNESQRRGATGVELQVDIAAFDEHAWSGAPRSQVGDTGDRNGDGPVRRATVRPLEDQARVVTVPHFQLVFVHIAMMELAKRT